MPEGPFTVKEAIDQFLAKEQPFTPHPVPDNSGTYDIEGRAIEIIDRQAQTEQERVEWNVATFPIFKQSLHLIINCLCYLTTQERDHVSKFPDDTPHTMIEKLVRATKPKEAARTLSKLTAMGYTQIHFCGHRTFTGLDPDITGRFQVPSATGE